MSNVYDFFCTVFFSLAKIFKPPFNRHKICFIISYVILILKTFIKLQTVPIDEEGIDLVISRRRLLQGI